MGCCRVELHEAEALFEKWSERRIVQPKKRSIEAARINVLPLNAEAETTKVARTLNKLQYEYNHHWKSSTHVLVVL